MGNLFQQLNADLASLVESVQRSVVQVRASARGVGAGSIWHPDGLIVTNAHVVRGGGALEVALADGRVLPARLLARDDGRDLAALSIVAEGLATIMPGSAKRLHAGQWVFAVGHPWGVTNAATGGVVIRVGKGLPEMNVSGDYVVTDTHLRPGNSGGPLVDASGQMVGVNTLITGWNVGVAVSVDSVKHFLKEALGEAASAQRV
jgi:S1-C subfamily serine protease